MTEQEAFFAEIRHDPYAHMITRIVVNAWAHGYEAALADIGGTGEGYSLGDLEAKAQIWLAGQQEKSMREYVIALAALGPLAMRRIH